MSSQLPSPHEIDRWQPPSLQHIVGCDELKSVLYEFVRHSGQGPNLLISGESGTGKTASVHAFFRTLNCPQQTGEPPMPCGECPDCLNFDVRDPDEGLFAIVRPRVLRYDREPLHYQPVNCGAVTEAELRQVLQKSRDYEGHLFIYLDEVHRIVRRKMDHLLLKPLEELNAVWIASSARTDELDPMFVRRFPIRISSSLPNERELTEFLADRCHEWGIVPHDPETLLLLARRSRQVVSECTVSAAAGD